MNVKLTGFTERFKGDGRKLGYPTANIRSDTDLADGVYFGYADLGKIEGQPALIFIGVPTTMGETERRVEAYLLDIPDKDYYGQQLRLSLVKYLRPSKKFGSAEELIEQIVRDEKMARELSAS